MKKLVIVFIFLFSELAISEEAVDIKRLNSSSGKSRICYFSLNNEKEFEVMKDFTGKLNKHSKHQIEVEEFQTFDSNPEKSFLKMVKSGKKCDGLVISGHHTGEFAGKRASGQLGIDFIEKLKCNKEYKGFFDNVKALWLQGCRTIGQKIVPMTSKKDELSDENGAVYHLLRLRDETSIDSIEVDLEALENSYATVFDKDNPLAPRFLSVFSRATAFGWDKKSPGEASKSELSIPFHIAHISKVLDPDVEEYFKNPRGDLTPEVAARYAQILMETLQRGNLGSKDLEGCLGISQKDLVEGWHKHGRKYGGEDKYSFANPDLKAFESFNEEENKILVEAQAHGCLMRSKDNKTALNSLDNVLNNISYIGPNYNLILGLLKSKDPKLQAEVEKKLQESTNFQKFLLRKIEDKSSGILTKLGLVSISTNLYGDKLKNDLRDEFYKYSGKILNVNDEDNWALSEYKREMLRRINRLDLNIIQELAKDKNLKPRAFRSIVEVARKFPKNKKDPILNVLLDNQNSGKYTLERTFKEIAYSSPGSFDEVVTKYLEHKSTSEFALLHISDELAYRKIKEDDKYIHQLLEHKDMSAYILNRLSELALNINNQSKSYIAILSHPKANDEVINKIETLIQDKSFEGKSEVLDVISAKIKKKR